MDTNPEPSEFVLLNEEPSYILPSNCTILATNVSSKATESSLREFFGICGVIKKISINPGKGENAVQSAIIVFENDEAAKTAIFLNDTFIIDTAINVVPYTGDIGASPQSSSPAAQPVQQREQAGQQENPGVLVNALASMYMFGAKAWQKVVEIDQKYQISETIQAKAQKVDESLGLTQKSHAAGEKISQVADNIDKSLHITENTNKLATKSNQKIEELKHRNEKTEKFFQNLESLGKRISNTWEETMKVAQQKVDLVKHEIERREEEEKKNNQGGNSNSNQQLQQPLQPQQPPSEASPLLADTDVPVQEEHVNVSSNTSN